MTSFTKTTTLVKPQQIHVYDSTFPWQSWIKEPAVWQLLGPANFVFTLPANVSTRHFLRTVHYQMVPHESRVLARVQRL